MSNWTPAQQRARYARLRSENRCVTCAGGMLPEWTGVHCPSCREKRSTYAESDAARAKRYERARTVLKAKYQEDPVKAAARQRAKRHEKKLRGECTRCVQPALDDSNFCASHLVTERARVRDCARRRRERQRQERQQARAA